MEYINGKAFRSGFIFFFSPTHPPSNICSQALVNISNVNKTQFIETFVWKLTRFVQVWEKR